MEREWRGAKMKYIPYIRAYGRVCTACKIPREYTDFFSYTSKDGVPVYKYSCRSCYREQRRVYEKTPKARERRRAWGSRNRGRVNAKNRERYIERKVTNAGGCTERRKAYMSKWRYKVKADPERWERIFAKSLKFQITTALACKSIDEDLTSKPEHRTEIRNALLNNWYVKKTVQEEGKSFRLFCLTTKDKPLDVIIVHEDLADKIFGPVHGHRYPVAHRASKVLMAIAEAMFWGHVFYTASGDLVTSKFLQKKAQEVGSFLGQKLYVFSML